MKPCIVVTVFLASSLTLCTAKIWEIPIPRSLQECYNQVQHANIQNFVGSTYSWLCESGIKKSQVSGPPQFDAQKTSYYKRLYDKSIEYTGGLVGTKRARGKRQAGQQRCVRKEYRMMTDEERGRFHDAINRLKQNTTVEPNKYDAIALLHTGMAAFTAHGGAGFPGWHRIYLLMFETALREEDPTVCVPYWDSSLDNEIEDPSLSSVWTPEFFGTAQGPVTEGPFANWITPEGAQLIRNVGSDGELFTAEAIEDVLSRTRHEDIVTSAEVDPRFDLEFHHAAVHVFCGGTMNELDTSAFDPVFFMHHAFVDYLWELFRTNLRSLGVDPEVYPTITDVDSRHHSTAPTGFGDLTQADGYLDALTDSYEYEAAPICTSRFPECGSRYLTCLERIGRCVPINPDIIVPPTPRPNPNPNPGPTPPPTPLPTCSRLEKAYGLPVQNDYCCDQTCDTSEWAMIPVKIVNVRPPNFSSYKSYPVQNGRVDIKNDIYSPSAYTNTRRFITRRLGNPKTYSRCTNDQSVGQIFLSSKGINYDGYYKEAAIVDQRLAVSISMGFIALKKPTRGKKGISKAIVRAHDSCGRVCHAACKDPASNEYKECSGAIALSTDYPKLYGSTYDEAVMSVFDYEYNNDCPRVKTENFFITFYCDYHNEFPYADHSHGPPPAPAPKPVPVVVPSSSNGCQVTSQCVLDVPCASEFRQCNLYNEKHVCRGSCRAYGLCTYGRYFLRLCPQGQYFDDISKSCVTGRCQKVSGSNRVVSNNPSGTYGGNTNSQVQHHGNSHSGHTHVSRQNKSRHQTPRPLTSRPYYSDLLSGFMRNLGR